MIPRFNIIAWSARAPWSEPRQIEQDLIISRALVALFSNPLLRAELRFRGGTALNKLIFPAPLRYSEDIDLVRTRHGPIGQLFDAIRAELEPWLGKANSDLTATSPKLRFRADADDGTRLRLKIEINTHEITAMDPIRAAAFSVENPWFTGAATLFTFSNEELLATKLRALLQRDKGRDLFDLAHALYVFPALDLDRLIACFNFYLKQGGQEIPRAEAERRMFAKYAEPRFLADLRPLLPSALASTFDKAAEKSAFERVFSQIIGRIPGAAWKRTEEMKQKFFLQL